MLSGRSAARSYLSACNTIKKGGYHETRCGITCHDRTSYHLGILLDRISANDYGSVGNDSKRLREQNISRSLAHDDYEAAGSLIRR